MEQSILQQEQELRLDTFTNKQAYQFGVYMADKLYANRMELAISIRKMNGAIIFQHLTESATMNNQNWLRRKFNTAAYMEKSSYAAFLSAQIGDKDLTFYGLTNADYALMGGAFPIRLKSGEIAAIAIASGLPHEQDHAFIVDSLREFMKL